MHLKQYGSEDELLSFQVSFGMNTSFGVPCSCEMVQAYKQHSKQKSLEIVDPALAASTAADQIARCIQIGLLCTQGDPRLRPDIGRVVLMLSKKPLTPDDQPISRPGMPGTRYRLRHP